MRGRGVVDRHHHRADLGISTDSERIAAAQAYIDALVSHDGNSVPFAPDCTRVEQGIKNGFSGSHLRRSLIRGPQYRIIEATTTPEYTIVGDEVRARYAVLTKLSVGGRRAGARVDETFVIPSDGLIHHIRVRFHPFLRSDTVSKPRPRGLDSAQSNTIIKWMSRGQTWLYKKTGGKLGGKGAVVIKVAKEGHDMRFDIPVVGEATVSVLRKAGVSAIAYQAGRLVMLELPKVIAAADKLGIAIIGLDSGLPAAPLRP